MTAPQHQFESNVELQEQLIRRAWEDEKFAELLRTNPRVAIAEETGVELPGDMNIMVHEETEETLHLVLPAPPEHKTDGPADIQAWDTQGHTCGSRCIGATDLCTNWGNGRCKSP